MSSFRRIAPNILAHKTNAVMILSETERKSIIEEESSIIMLAKILIDGPAGRWTKGEIGKVLENDFTKYDYFVELSGELTVNLGKEITYRRRFYFHRDEVEILWSLDNSRS